MSVNVCVSLCVCVRVCVCVHACNTRGKCGHTGKNAHLAPLQTAILQGWGQHLLEERVAGTFLWVWCTGSRGSSHLHSTHSQRQKPWLPFLEKTICCYSKLFFWGLVPPTSKWLLEHPLQFHTSISLNGLLESMVLYLITILVTLWHKRSPLTDWTWVHMCVCRQADGLVMTLFLR